MSNAPEIEAGGASGVYAPREGELYALSKLKDKILPLTPATLIRIIEMPITNRDRFPSVDFLPDEEIKPIGDVEGTALVLLGKEQGTDAAVVARSYTSDPASEQLHAVPLYELISHTFGSVNITEEL